MLHRDARGLCEGHLLEDLGDLDARDRLAVAVHDLAADEDGVDGREHDVAHVAEGDEGSLGIDMVIWPCSNTVTANTSQ